MDYQKVIQNAIDSLTPSKNSGKQATYIPELAKVNPDLFGVTLTCVNGEQYNYGDTNIDFSVQSITKVLSLVMAYRIQKNDLWKRLDVEPSGSPFNSLILLETEKGIPRNPFINAGAIVIADILISSYENPLQEFMDFVHLLTEDTNISCNDKVYQSEKKVAYTNYALVNMMKSFGNIHNDIDEVMDFYFKMCSLEMNTQQLTKAFLFLANNGRHPNTKAKILSPQKTKRVNAIMQLCGFYDEAGEFAYRVGLPGKSGVGGGIIAIHPGKFTVTVFSPKLNEKGNSKKGMAFLEALTTELESSIF